MEEKSKILIVDDSLSTLTLLNALLSAENYTTLSATTGEVALKLLEDESPELILLDIVMPGIDGFEVCRRIKSDSRLIEIPIIFLSASSKIEERVQGLKLGAIDFLSKPFEREELLLKVKIHLELYTYHKIFKERTAEQLIEQETHIIQQNSEYKSLNEKLKESEKKLHASSHYVRSLLESSLDPFVTINADGKITDLNLATEKITGLSRNDLVGTDFSDYFTEPEKAKASYQKVFNHGSIIDFPLTIRHSSGKLIDVLYNVSLYRDEQGQIVGIFATARDITERKKAIEALKASEDKLRLSYQYARSLIEASIDPLVTINLHGKITDVNSATEKITGIKRINLIGTDFSDYFTEPENARMGYQKAFETGSIYDYPLTIRHNSGILFDVLYNASVYHNEHGKIIGVVAAARDITKSKQAELTIKEQNNELIKLNEDKNRFISILAHDIKSPFNSILGFLCLLTENIREYDINEIEEQINIVNNSALYTFRLLEDILLWARAQSGKMPFKPQKQNLDDTCNEVIQSLLLTAKNKNISIILSPINNINVLADKDMLTTILRNLISNAIKFTKNDGEIIIKAELNHKDVIVTISDNGIGIKPENLSKLFNITEKISTEGTANETGSGFGLLLCKEFIEKQGGKIWIESKVNIGSQFHFTIPLYNN